MNEMRLKFIQPDGGQAKGLTNIWNLMYSHFKANAHYENIFILNNDILVGDGLINKMATALALGGGGYHYIGPITTLKGAPARQPMQRIEERYGPLSSKEQNFVTSPLN
eukprot:CFRG4194T1